MIRPQLDAELDEAVEALRSANTVADLTAAANWIKRLLQQMWDEALR